MSEVLGRPIYPQRGWEYLKSLEMRRRRPRPEHVESDLDTQESWKKKLAQTVAEVKAAHPEAEVTAWAEDEHRVGLHLVNRMVWVPLGQIPMAQVNWEYQWLWLVGFVEPKTGQTYWWIVPKLNGPVFSQVLADFAAHLA